MNKRNVLTAVLTDSFKMTKNSHDGTSVKTRRYVYHITGSKEAMDLFKADTIAKTNIGGVMHDDGRLLFYSWQPGFKGTAIELIRSDNKGTWFLDTSDLDKLNSLATNQPELVKLLGDSLLDRIFGKVAVPVVQEEEEKEEEEQHQDDDIK